MSAKRIFLTMLLGSVVSATSVRAEERVGELKASDLERLISAIKPDEQVSSWRKIDWFVNVTEARRKASAENKPIIIFTAVAGHPLCRT